MMNNSRSIIAGWVRKASERLKYNFSFLMMLEDVGDEPSDRTAYDVGIEPDSKPHVHDNLLEDNNEPF